MDIEHLTVERAVTSAAFIGAGTLLARCAEVFVRAGHGIRVIVSSEPLVRQWADEHGIRCIGDEDGLDVLATETFDYLFNVGGLRLLPPAVLGWARRLAVNFHDGPLPRYAGLNAPSWALLNREVRHGVTWHEMTAGVDAGGILAAESFEILPGDGALTLNARCYEAGIASFAELVRRLTNGTLTPIPQDLAQRTYFGAYRRPEAACALRWDRPAESLAALAAALDFGPYRNPLGLPKLLLGDGALGERAIAVRAIRVLGERSGAAPGTIIRLDDEALHVATASADVALDGLATLEGHPLARSEAAARFGLATGQRLPVLGDDAAERLSKLYERVCRHESFWIERLGVAAPPEIPYARPSSAEVQPPQNLPAADRFESVGARLPVDLGAPLPLHGEATPGDRAVTLLAAYVARLGAGEGVTLRFSEPALPHAIEGAEALFTAHVPLRVRVDRDAPLTSSLAAQLEELSAVRRHETYARDLVPRTPALRTPPLETVWARSVVVEIVDNPDAPYAPPEGCQLAVLVAADGTTSRWLYDPRTFAGEDVAAMQRQLATLARAAVARPETPLRALPLLDDDERQRVLVEWNDTARPYDDGAMIHGLIAAQAARTPDRTALVFEEDRLTYRELDAAANRLAHGLRAFGVGPESLVGVCLERSTSLVASLLAVMRAGGAYVPLDPGYPRERLRAMVEDARLAALVTTEDLVGLFDDLSCPRVLLDRDAERLAEYSPEPPVCDASSAHAAYVIYTSGSTGRPKGVVVTHRNVASFFAGMDARIPRDEIDASRPPGVWLAVTSPSFDISVLEMFWTLARGFTVVLGGEAERAPRSVREAPPAASEFEVHSAPPAAPGSEGHEALPNAPGSGVRDLDFSLFYFASNSAAAEAYRLLLDGARFADRHGFSAVWTPERHFHAFGGLFPNPSVAAAALATITQRVRLRAGSCVLPLHSPIRVAEEWALVDNLSNGRVGISFAAGWQPNDFVLAPDAFRQRVAVMRRDIDVVRRLWRGEAVTFPGPDGALVAVSTLPRPVQPELPTWITAASNPETFRLAGELGCGVLTHLLGQRYADVREKVSVYREAWRAAGHPGRGHVVLMVHTFVADDPELVRSTVREPLIGYLRDSVDLIEKAAWSFPAFAGIAERTGLSPADLFDRGRLSDDDLSALLEHAFERYFATSGLFGTPESCLETLEHIGAADVDEVACLIDFGIEADVVLANLPNLARLMELARGTALTSGESEPVTPASARRSVTEATGVGGNVAADDYSIPTLIRRHGVTHLQCTPSLAEMLVPDARARAALGSLRCLMVGGEALPAPLAAELKRLVAGDVLNMYGPTETTIWSATYAVNGDEEVVPIGRPIPNATLWVVDEDDRPVPTGVTGELLIGGPGVARGYLRRPELTAERFIPNPFVDTAASAGAGVVGAGGSGTVGSAGDPTGAARLYRTGDRVRYRRDGVLEFLGRIDHQVKLRGHRIELGEIEAVLRRHPSVREAAVVLVDERSGGAALIAHVTPANGAVDADELRAWVGRALPAIMVPARVDVRNALPRTPNGKLDRRALEGPSPTTADNSATVETADASGATVAMAAASGATVAMAAGLGVAVVTADGPAAQPGDIEAAIAGVWREVLGLTSIDVTASFFDLGGHSLLAAQVIYLLRARLGRELAITDLFRFPTVRALGRHLEQADPEDTVRAGRERAESRRDILTRRRLARQPFGR